MNSYIYSCNLNGVNIIYMVIINDAKTATPLRVSATSTIINPSVN
jgi:hypothetical protein